MRAIKKIILHCTATKEGEIFSVETIRKWHLKRGWSDIGYHYLIAIDGTIDLGRPVFKQGAHTQGENQYSIGIAYVGGVDAQSEAKDTMTAEQEESFLMLYNSLKIVFGPLSLHGHNEFSNKACPSFIVNEKYKFLTELNKTK